MDGFVQLNVLVSIISEPADKYSAWISVIISGCVKFRRSLLPFKDFSSL